MCGTLTINDAEYTVIKLLGKGKGGYSYLVTDGTAQYVLKQIHHEPCEYYAFGDKLQAELHDYETLRKLGISMSRLLAVDTLQERILKEYIAGQTVAELLKGGGWNPTGLNRWRPCAACCTRLDGTSTTIPPTLSRAAKRFTTSTMSAMPTWSNGTWNIGASSIGRRRHRKGRI